MTKLETVLAEEWFADDGEIGDAAETNQPMLCRFRGTQAQAELRAAVAVLGHRALALVLNHEWSNVQEESGAISCPECDGYKPGTVLGPTGHTPGCTWGAICEEARRLG